MSQCCPITKLNEPPIIAARESNKDLEGPIPSAIQGYVSLPIKARGQSVLAQGLEERPPEFGILAHMMTTEAVVTIHSVGVDLGLFPSE
jgi:hypothetical protein